jgi:hypothetical protein
MSYPPLDTPVPITPENDPGFDPGHAMFGHLPAADRDELYRAARDRAEYLSNHGTHPPDVERAQVLATRVEPPPAPDYIFDCPGDFFCRVYKMPGDTLRFVFEDQHSDGDGATGLVFDQKRLDFLANTLATAFTTYYREFD